MIDKLKELLNNSRSDYFNFPVSAAVVCTGNRVFYGVNVETSSPQAGICAERNALYNAFTNGIKKSDIKEIVFDIRKEKNPCSLCANLRRGIINSVAQREGCNKIALGHNLDDVIETFMMNLKYAGNISTFTPKSYMDRSGITMIRPLILLTEKDTNHFVKKYNKSTMPKVCPMDEHTKREDIKAEILAWQKEIPTIKANLFGAISRNLW